jgi:phage terminase large subunit-like protein
MPTLYLPQLRRDQWLIAQHPAKIKTLAMGRRWGKTILGGSVSLSVASAGGKVAWVVPTYKNGRPLWRWAMQFVGPLKKNRLVRTNISERLIEFNNGGFLGIYSADNEDSIRGDWFHLVIVDEAAMVSETAWQEVIQPTLADVDGDAILIGTPKGRNWFFTEYQRGLADGTRQAAFQAPTGGNPSPQIQRAFQLAKERLPERVYRQEWLAEFLEGQGVVFRNIRPNLTAPLDARPADHIGHRLVMGVDWGKSNDYTVLSVFCADCRQEVTLDRFNKIEYSFQRGRLTALADRWKISHIEAEANSIGEPNIEELRRSGLPVVGFQTTATSKPPLIESLALAFEKQEAAWLPDEVAAQELEAYEMKLNSTTGRPTYGALEGLHDDTVIARALAWRAAIHAPGWTVWARQQLKQVEDDVERR